MANLNDARSRLQAAVSAWSNKKEDAPSVYLARYIELADEDKQEHLVAILNPDGTEGSRIRVYGDVKPWPDALVRVTRDRKRWGDASWVIVGVERESYIIDGVTPPDLMHLHGEEHGWDGTDRTNNLHMLQIFPLRVQPQATGVKYDVLPGAYPVGATYAEIKTVTEVDLSSYVPANGAKWVLLTLTESATVNVTEGDAEAAITIEDVPRVPEGEFALAAIWLEAGDTSASTSRVRMDLRFLNSVQGLSVDVEEKLASGQLPSASNTLYTAPAGENVRVTRIVIHNTNSSSEDIQIKMDGQVVVDFSLEAGGTYIDATPRTLDALDLIEGHTDTASKVDYSISGIVDVATEQLYGAQVPAAATTAYTVAAGQKLRVESITLHNSKSTALDISVKLDSRVIVDIELGGGHTHIIDGAGALDASETIVVEAEEASKIYAYITGEAINN
jgi:hypothetical protein